ncbi:DNA gyrase subunit A [SAR202 cluster bacterium AD-804-J14_MRT_500m]|nr:DNA gyrase subunit A [SAR202 cluster bacterium AD-804-J14_MRT_500m]
MITTPDERTHPIRIEEEMRTSYLKYAMSVIVSRALPDVRDGLKPVQRRILYAMHELSLGPNSQHKKCARIVGEVLGKYHPHGDSSVYDALVRMGQDFSLRYPLIDGQGNFGSIDDDPPAAMRYTEAKLARIAQESLADIELDTVDFSLNFDDSLKEPKVLPSRQPNLLINGASGIAVGMATNIPPHNLGEISDAICYIIDHPDAYIDDLLNIIKGPDFPTKGIALVGKNKEFLRQIYTTGHGRVIMRAKAEIEESNGNRFQIVISELPYQLNKASLVARIAQMVRDKKLEGISDIRDESDRKGMRVVIELKRDARAQMVLNSLYKHTSMQSSFSVTNLALVDGQPQILTLKRSLQLFVEHRQIVITRRSEFLLQRAKDRAHILEGLRKAIELLDLVIKLIRAAKDVETAKINLIKQLELTEIQAQAILDMQLRRLAALERQKLDDEYQVILNTIKELEELLGDPSKLLTVIKEETQKLKKDYSSPRLTRIILDEPKAFNPEDDVQHQDVVITISGRDYIKRIPMTTYRSQLRGGRGVKGMTTREDDAARHLLTADTHDVLLLFTNRGRVYTLRAFQIAEASSRTSRGTSLVNLVNLAPGERISAVLPTPKLDMAGKLVLGTRNGSVKALRLKDLANMRSNGLIVMALKTNDELVSVRTIQGKDDVIIVTRNGKSIRFPCSQVPVRTRPAGGVKGIKLLDSDYVIGMEIMNAEDKILVISEGGYGKLMSLAKYPRQRRNGQGVISFPITRKSGPLSDARLVTVGVENEVMLVSSQSKVYRTGLQGIPTQGRTAGGVILWRPGGSDRVASISCFQDSPKLPE